MATQFNARAPKGTADMLPRPSLGWERLIRIAQDLFARYGYRPIYTPVFEHTEVFTRGIGEATDIVSKEMYTFEDKGGRSITLRPEATAGVVRAALEHGLTANGQSAKVYYAAARCFATSGRRKAVCGSSGRSTPSSSARPSRPPTPNSSRCCGASSRRAVSRPSTCACSSTRWATRTAAPRTATKWPPTSAPRRMGCARSAIAEPTPTLCALSTARTRLQRDHGQRAAAARRAV